MSSGRQLRWRAAWWWRRPVAPILGEHCLPTAIVNMSKPKPGQPGDYDRKEGVYTIFQRFVFVSRRNGDSKLFTRLGCAGNLHIPRQFIL